MKIIYSDNIPDDLSGETVWIESIPVEHKYTAQRICDKLNERLGDFQGPFYRLVEDDHKLYRWEP